MAKEYDYRGSVDVYEERPKKSLGWFWWAIILFVLWVIGMVAG